MSVVDDELDIMSLFRDAFSQIDGTQAVGFTDSTLALEHFKLNQSGYNLILSDFRVPYDGWNGTIEHGQSHETIN